MRKTFETPGPVELTLKVPAGEISLETTDGSQTEVVLEPLHADEASREAVESSRVEMRERALGGQEVMVEVGEGRRFALDLGEGRRLGFSFGRGAEVVLKIRSPHGANVGLQTGSGDVEAAGRFGAVEAVSGSGDLSFPDLQTADLKTGSGDVSIDHVHGEATVQVGSGDISLDNAGSTARISAASGDVFVGRLRGPGSISTASGDVRVKELDSSLEISTASGDQLVEAVLQGAVALKSASGDMQIGIRQGSTLWVDAKSRIGSTSSELDVSDAPPEAGGPLVELRASTMSGDIRIVRAAALIGQTAVE